MKDATTVMMSDDNFQKGRKMRDAERPKLAEAQHVLLVEDCQHTRLLIAHMLQKLGLQVTTAEDGESFVEYAINSEVSGTPFDLVLLDINLPKLNGVQATEMLRKAGYERPIIAITAGPSLQDRNDSIYAGCDNFLAKSELHLTLVPTLQEYLKLHSE